MRIYDFDKLDCVSDALGMDLVKINGNYIDRASATETVNCNSYLGWQIVRMLDELPDDDVSELLFEYLVREKGCGYLITGFWTYEEAEKQIEEFEQEDMDNENYTENFYEIVRREDL